MMIYIIIANKCFENKIYCNLLNTFIFIISKIVIIKLNFETKYKLYVFI